ncbi:MAG: hypothetical protein COV70_00105 [Parcubacteria group bacterium CG11_big_fil_rev_8_21_14_0_20_39_22]|nr:MAG: hypothetical protein COV70_00105 [Parcubacteria group bacterium CG11_big_fil_rev_8_21_14_0_20_39_22]
MLNTFPSLLDFAPLAPFILRVAAGFWFIDIAFKNYKEIKREAKKFTILSILIVQAVAGLFLVAGFLTQISAIVLFIILTFFVIRTEEAKQNPETKQVHLFLFIILISLLVTGAGAFAFDLPL